MNPIINKLPVAGVFMSRTGEGCSLIWESSTKVGVISSNLITSTNFIYLNCSVKASYLAPQVLEHTANFPSAQLSFFQLFGIKS